MLRVDSVFSRNSIALGPHPATPRMIRTAIDRHMGMPSASDDRLPTDSNSQSLVQAYPKIDVWSATCHCFDSAMHADETASSPAPLAAFVPRWHPPART